MCPNTKRDEAAHLVEYVRVGDLLQQTVRDADVRLGRVEARARRGAHDLRAERAQHVHLGSESESSTFSVQTPFSVLPVPRFLV